MCAGTPAAGHSERLCKHEWSRAAAQAAQRPRGELEFCRQSELRNILRCKSSSRTVSAYLPFPDLNVAIAAAEQLSAPARVVEERRAEQGSALAEFSALPVFARPHPDYVTSVRLALSIARTTLDDTFW